MFEDFRNQSDESLFEHQDADEEALWEDLTAKEPEVHFLGMTAAQRFALVLLLFIMISILGMLFLFITDRVYPPAFS